MRGVAAQRIVRTIRKPRNKADEAIAPKPGGTGLAGRSALSRRSPMGACHGLRVASRISSRKAAVAATRDLFRGSLSAAALGNAEACAIICRSSRSVATDGQASAKATARLEDLPTLQRRSLTATRARGDERSSLPHGAAPDKERSDERRDRYPQLRRFQCRRSRPRRLGAQG